MSAIGIFRQLLGNVSVSAMRCQCFFTVEHPLQQPEKSKDGNEQQETEDSGSFARTPTKTANPLCQGVNNDKMNSGD